MLATTSFGSSYSHPFSAGSAYVGNTAQVVVTAWDDPTGSRGWTKTFNKTVAACLAPTPTPTPTPTPSGSVLAETSVPQITPPPTDGLTSTSAPSSGSWFVLLLGMAALIVVVLAVKPAPARTRR